MKKNTAVYVTGLPPDVTVTQLADYFGKCGVIMQNFEADDYDPTVLSTLAHSGSPRIKIYSLQDDDGNEVELKSSALVIYLKPESVPLAIMLLDETEFLPGYRIHVEEASWSHSEEKDDHDSNEKKRREEMHKLDKETWRRKMERLASKTMWSNDDLEEQLNLKRQLEWHCIILLRHVTPIYSMEALEDIRQECVRLFSSTTTKKANVIKVSWLTDPPNVISIKFGDRFIAQRCQQIMHHRWYSGHQLEADVYNGNPRLVRYKPESERNQGEEEEEERIESFSKWIEQASDDDNEKDKEL